MISWEQFTEDMGQQPVNNQFAAGLKKVYGSNTGVKMTPEEFAMANKAKQILKPTISRLQQAGLTIQNLPILIQVMNQLMMGNTNIRTNIANTKDAMQNQNAIQ
jgi:hypothetical protein